MIAGILMVIGSLALVSICGRIAYDEGKHRGLEELDGTIEIVRALGETSMQHLAAAAPPDAQPAENSESNEAAIVEPITNNH